MALTESMVVENAIAQARIEQQVISSEERCVWCARPREAHACQSPCGNQFLSFREFHFMLADCAMHPRFFLGDNLARRMITGLDERDVELWWIGQAAHERGLDRLVWPQGTYAPLPLAEVQRGA